MTGSASYSVHANTVGWPPNSTISVSYTLYLGPSGTGPWTETAYDAHTCTKSTSCSTVTSEGTCTNGWYKLVARANGPGGAAENSPDVKIKHIYGVPPALTPQGAAGVSVAPGCYNGPYKPI